MIKIVTVTSKFPWCGKCNQRLCDKVDCCALTHVKRMWRVKGILHIPSPRDYHFIDGEWRRLKS